MSFKNYLTTMVLQMAILWLTAMPFSMAQSLNKFKVQFAHKASVTGGKEHGTLVEYHINQTPFYYMDVKSVFCGENVCKVDPVRLHWDRFGQYKKLELLANVKLEKGNAQDFTTEDYKKLDEILSNKTSGLNDLEKSQLVTTSPNSSSVDGLSGATTYILNADYIKGAIWTCYTLWHYAHGPLSQIVQNTSARLLTNTELIKLLPVQYNYALKQLYKRQYINQDIIDIVTHYFARADISSAQLTVQYLTLLSSPQQIDQLIKLIASRNHKNIDLVFAQLKLESTQFSQAQLNALAAQIQTLTQYAHIAKTFRLMSNVLQKKHINIQQLSTYILPVLEQEHFITARMTYWYMKELGFEQDPNIAHKMQLFYQANKDKL